MERRNALIGLATLAVLLLCAQLHGVSAHSEESEDDGAAEPCDTPLPTDGIKSTNAATECNCEKLQYSNRKCRYNKQLCRSELAAARATGGECVTELDTCKHERSQKDASIRSLIADRQHREKSDVEWRDLMRSRAEACAPRDEPERVWVQKQQQCLDEKYECIRERRDRDIALRDCLQSAEPYSTWNRPPPGTPLAADAAALKARTDAGISPNAVPTVTTQLNDGGGEAVPSDFVWPTVSVLCPVCVKRHRWLPNMYAMFKHQDYPGKMELIVMDGVCSKMLEVPAVESQFLLETAKVDPRVKYHFFPDPNPPVIGAKRNWLVRHASNDVIVTFDVDDYYGPHYISRMVWLLTHSSNDTGMVKLHSWFSLGEGWLMDPTPRRHKAWTYIDMEHDPMGWGWTYVYWRKTYDNPLIHFGEVDASEEAGFFHSLRNNGWKIGTFADRWFLCLRIVTWSIVRTTGAGVCKKDDRGCTNLPDFMVIKGFGGSERLKPWVDLWDQRE